MHIFGLRLQHEANSLCRYFVLLIYLSSDRVRFFTVKHETDRNKQSGNAWIVNLGYKWENGSATFNLPTPPFLVLAQVN